MKENEYLNVEIYSELWKDLDKISEKYKAKMNSWTYVTNISAYCSHLGFMLAPNSNSAKVLILSTIFQMEKMYDGRKIMMTEKDFEKTNNKILDILEKAKDKINA